jgi:hypothetical protein
MVVLEAQLAWVMRKLPEAAIAGEMKRIVAREFRIGIDLNQVDLVLSGNKIEDEIALVRGHATVPKLDERECVGVGASLQDIAAAESKKRICVGTALDDIGARRTID